MNALVMKIIRVPIVWYLNHEMLVIATVNAMCY